jgi:hypothetical protein
MPQIETKNENVRKLAVLHLYHDPLSSCAMRVRMGRSHEEDGGRRPGRYT